MLLVNLVQAVLDPICFRLVDPTVISKEWKSSPYVTYPHGSHGASLSQAPDTILRETEQSLYKCSHS